MDKQNIRLIFLCAIFFVGMFLFTSWQQDHAPLPQSEVIANQRAADAAKPQNDLPAPLLAQGTSSKAGGAELYNQLTPTHDAKRILDITTDTMHVKIDALGGDLVYVSLPKYPETLQEPEQGFVLLDESEKLFYTIQTGLLSEDGPDSGATGRALYKFKQQNVVMDADESVLNIDLHYVTKNGVQIIKRFIFERDSYVIRTHFIIDNKSQENYQASVFGRIKRRAPSTEGSGMFGAMRTYTGAAINTPNTKYKKLPFDDMKKKPFKEDVMGGWAAMVEHYFATAIVPSVDVRNYYQTEDFGDNVYGIRFVSTADVILPGTQKIIEVKIYTGPEVASQLKAVAPGLELTIDYGLFWFLCQPIFWLLSKMFEVFGNWGVAIIFTTIIIKGLFYKLSAHSYKSMGNMRKLQPKIEALKLKHGDDKQKFSQDMMALYKTEKINPLGGCLPIVVQIPVFIALYYVLLECVELRQAPFMWWIHDLSAKDPLYVLPLIMGVSMFVQQRLNPAPPDPIQAKVMMFMPVFFTFLFLQFPSGLVLYWVVNNLLSILQQWMITRKIEKAGK